MMKKDYLLYLKKMAAVGCIATSICALTGCGEKLENDDIGKPVEKEDTTSFHIHVMVDIDGTTYIFRECEDEISKIRASLNYGSIHYKIYDKDDEKIIDSYAYSDSYYNTVDSEAQEQAIREIEDKSIENGAILYRGIGSTRKN